MNKEDPDKGGTVGSILSPGHLRISNVFVSPHIHEPKIEHFFPRLGKNRQPKKLTRRQQQRKRHLPRNLNSRCFKLHRYNSTALNLSNVGDFFGDNPERLHPRSEKGKGKSLSCIYVLHNTCNQEVSCRSRTRTAKKCVTKKRDSRAKLLFC